MLEIAARLQLILANCTTSLSDGGQSTQIQKRPDEQLEPHGETSVPVKGTNTRPHYRMPLSDDMRLNLRKSGARWPALVALLAFAQYATSEEGLPNSQQSLEGTTLASDVRKPRDPWPQSYRVRDLFFGTSLIKESCQRGVLHSLIVMRLKH